MLKNAKNTHPSDIPSKVRKEYDIFFAEPLKDIFNQCLKEQIYPEIWKCNPYKKGKNALKITDLRKIAKTPENSKCFEGFIKEWILEDIEENLDPSQ